MEQVLVRGSATPTATGRHLSRPGATTLRELIDGCLQQFLGAERTKSFLQDVATAGHQWNVLLPTLVGLTGARKLPEPIVGQINRLRKLRNAVGHGNEFKPGDRNAQAQLLVAAAIAVDYLLLVTPDLVPPGS